MPTAQVLMDRAFRSLGALRVGASASDDMQTEGLAMLNALIDRVQTDSMTVPQVLTSTKTLTIGDAEYTVGTGQDIAIARPIDIQDTSFLRYLGQDYPLEKLTRQQYNAIGSKADQGMPESIFYDDRYPVGYLYLYPVPDQAYTLQLDYLSPISTFATAATDIAMPPAAESFVWTALALDLLPLYPNPDVAGLVTMAATRARNAFSKTNVRVPILRQRFSGSTAYNVISDR